ncbi:MAG: orotidine-5'-phosphate decarboxylase [Acidimicrobiales bacterium]
MADNGGGAAGTQRPAGSAGPARGGSLPAGQLGLSAPGDDARLHLALALDFDDSVVAMRWAARLKDHFGVAKVGLELFSAAGPSAVAELVDAGFKVFVDLKLADIPNTTRRAARVLGALGASYLTVHTSMGPGTVRAAAEGFAEGADRAGLPAPVALGVTVLTSEVEASAELVRAAVKAARDAGCRGFVCAASDLAWARDVAAGMIAVVPGIRLVGGEAHDQGRTATPARAVRGGADLLVVGRAVTEAEDPEGAAEAILAEVESALGKQPR